MEFRVLGPVEVWSAGERVDAGHIKQRAVLAVLLLDLGKVVPIDLLVDRVWGDDPPASVRNNLYAYVARLRAMIASAADTGVRLSRRSGGYLLQADPDQVDLYAFRRRVRLAAAADDQRAVELLGEALGLWRGPALAGLASPWLRSMRDALEQECIVAVLDRGDIALREGQHAALASTLAEHAVARPADERLIGQLMTALYRSGRQAEALRWFDQTRRHLADELGADPGPELKTLHQRILRNDPALAAPAPAHHRGAPVPRELPADIRAFTGRSAELTELDRLLTGAATEPAAVVISALSGTAGVGKTALAVHWAQHVAEQFPDGQLYVNLRGYDPGRPVAAAEALAGFLRALGVPGQDIPADPAERAARYRSLISGKRMLVLLDNASDVEQVRPLLPGTTSCVAVVTSRDSLAGLVARDGARRFDLDLLSYAEAVDLLRALIGRRVDADPAAAIELAARCARLPLALRVAAELAVARPAVALADLAVELADGQQRLDLLDADGDPRTAVRAVFSWSYRHLPPATARAFRLLSLHPNADFDQYATAALTGSTLAQAGQQLDQLASAHLIQVLRPGWYTMHDLLRAYARELTGQHDAEQTCRDALSRLFDYYLFAAAGAMAAAHPREASRLPRVPRPASPVPPLPDPVAARAWLDAQRPGFAAVVAHCADHGWPSHATRLAAVLALYLHTGGYRQEAQAVHGHARHAAMRSGDLAAEAEALINLGVTDQLVGRREQAVDELEQGVALASRAGNPTIEALALSRLGIIDMMHGRYQRARRRMQRALDLHRQTGEEGGQSACLVNLGIVDMLQGRYQQAAGNYRQALALARAMGSPYDEAHALQNLGEAYRRMGRYQEASEAVAQSRRTHREIGDKRGEATAATGMGFIDLQQGRYQQALRNHEQALAIFREIADRSGEADALNGLGEVMHATGMHIQAQEHHAAALGIALEIDRLDLQAEAHDGLARAEQAIGDRDRARDHWLTALDIFTELGAPEADEVRAELSKLAGADDGGAARQTAPPSPR